MLIKGMLIKQLVNSKNWSEVLSKNSTGKLEELKNTHKHTQKFRTEIQSLQGAKKAHTHKLMYESSVGARAPRRA